MPANDPASGHKAHRSQAGGATAPPPATPGSGLSVRKNHKQAVDIRKLLHLSVEPRRSDDHKLPRSNQAEDGSWVLPPDSDMEPDRVRFLRRCWGSVDLV
jgi:hypothetical protein